MKEKINDAITHLLNSFNNNKDGYSAKKLTVFAIVLCVMTAHAKWIALGNFEQLTTVLTIDFAFISTILGINVADKKVNGTSDDGK